jgi:hypothetical protein
MKGHKHLVELNLELINFVRDYLGITTSALCASEVAEGRGSDLILKLCQNRNADIYLSGPDGRNYLNLEAFKGENIKVTYHDYQHPAYEQLFEPFISHMSVIDLLFNYGKNSVKFIRAI